MSDTPQSSSTLLQRFLAPANRLTIAATLALLIVLTIWMAFTPEGILGKADAIGYAVCHRITIRSFAFSDNRQFPLCARCSGMFLGVLIGLFGPGLLLGRKRMGYFPPLGIIVVLVTFTLIWAFDGANSFTFLLPPGVPHLYTPSNLLRLLTGMGQGITMGSLLLPVANSMLWADVKPEAALAKPWHLLALLGVGGVVCAMILADIDIFAYPLAILSAAGVVTILTTIATVVVTSILRRENTVRTLRDAVPMIMLGMVACFLLIGGIDLLRFIATGTWDGFVSPPV